MAKHSQQEVKRSLHDLTRIYRPTDAKKFVKDFIRKYHVTSGYEAELTKLVEREMLHLKTS